MNFISCFHVDVKAGLSHMEESDLDVMEYTKIS